MKKIINILSLFLSIALLASCGEKSPESTASDIPKTTVPVSTEEPASPGIAGDPATSEEAARANRDLTAELTFEAEGQSETVNAELMSGKFEDGPYFSLYVDTALYEGSQSEGRYYYSAKNVSGDAYLEISFFKDTLTDEIAGSFLEAYDTVKSTEDYGEERTAIRHIGAIGENNILDAYFFQGAIGVFVVVTAVSHENSEVHAPRLNAMVNTVQPE